MHRVHMSINHLNPVTKKITNFIKFSLFNACFLCLIISPKSVATDNNDQAVINTNSPKSTRLTSDSPSLKPLSGRRVYKRVCMACHTLSVWGAPKLGDREAWEKRTAKGKETLYYSVLNGFNKMPSRGYCQFCTDDELKSAVDYIISKAQPRGKTESKHVLKKTNH